jgi:hypothetical protein
MRRPMSPAQRGAMFATLRAKARADGLPHPDPALAPLRGLRGRFPTITAGRPARPPAAPTLRGPRLPSLRGLPGLPRRMR